MAVDSVRLQILFYFRRVTAITKIIFSKIDALASPGVSVVLFASGIVVCIAVVISVAVDVVGSSVETVVGTLV